MSKFTTSQSVGEIVAIMPRASEVFKAFNIDFCCGGHRSLLVNLEELNLNERDVLNALDAAYEETKKITGQIDFKSLSRSDLIEYIINTHHTFVRRILPEISQFSTKILQVHGMGHNELFTVHKLFHALKAELEQHLIKEEELLFPLIKQYDQEPSEDLLGRIKTVMQETEDEHEAAGDILKELRKVTDDYTMPEDGCTTYALTYQKIQELESDLFEHIHLENNILFKEFE